jgi:uncharacterized protein DUF4326
MPVRIQRKRVKGFKLPAGSRFCGRPTKYGNPFRVGRYGRVLALELFDAMLANHELRKQYKYPTDEQIREELRGRDLSCWCEVDEDCHVSRLLEIANK